MHTMHKRRRHFGEFGDAFRRAAPHTSPDARESRGETRARGPSKRCARREARNTRASARGGRIPTRDRARSRDRGRFARSDRVATAKRDVAGHREGVGDA